MAHPASAVALGVILALALASLQVMTFRQLAGMPEESSGVFYHLVRKLMPQNLAETLPFVALICTVSLCEEFLFRGFAFAVFQNAISEMKVKTKQAMGKGISIG